MPRLAAFTMMTCLCVLVATSAVAQSDLGFKGFGGRIGYVGPEDIDGTFGIGVVADMGTITPNILLEPYMSFWTRSQTEFGTELSARDIALGSRGKYVFDVKNSNIRPFAGAGLGVHFLHAKISVPEQDFGGLITPAFSAEDSSVKLGLDLGGGMFVPINNRWDFMTELWYGIVSDVNQVSLSIGAMYKM